VSIEIGPVLDSAGAEVNSTMLISDFRLVKNGTGAAMASAASITHVANGHYTLSMTTGNTDTLGTLTVSCHKTGAQMPRSQMMVLPVKVYDSIVAGSDNLEVDAIQLLGTAILTPAVAGTLDVNAKQFGGATVNATTSVTIPTSATLATTAGAVGSVTGNVTGSVGSVTGLTAANLDTTISSRASQTSLDTLDDLVDTEVAAIKTKTDQLTFTVANQIDANSLTNGGLSASATRSAIGLATANLDTQIGTLATPTNITTATGITVSSIGADAITASALATDAVNEIVDQVWDELLSGHTGAGSTGAGLSAAGAAGDPWSTLIPGAYGAGTAGKILGDNVNATISSRASQTSLDTLDDLVDTEVGAIKTKTDQLTFTVANQIDANSLTIGANVITASALATDAVNEIQSGLATPTNITAITGNITGNLSGSVGSVTNAVGSVTGAVTVGTINADVITASALATDAVNEIADQVWDELLSGHATAGSTGAGLTSASSAGDPWSTALPGSYGAGTAGKIVGDNVNATISSRASQTSLDTLDDLVDTEVGAIKTKTDQLTFTVANQIDANTLTIGNNVITAAAIATDAIGSAEISAAAVTKIQSGLATPTNITAGTITTVSSVTGLTAANLDTTVSSRASQTSLDALDASVTTASTEIF
jgi:hypothetical protein